MAEEVKDKASRAADAIHKIADTAEESLAREGYGADYPNKSQDRDFRKGYVQACRDVEKVLRE